MLILIGEVRNSLVETAAVRDFCAGGLEIMRALGDTAGQAYALHRIAQIHLSAKDRRKAADCFEQALAQLKLVKDLNLEVLILNTAGLVYESSGEHEKAHISLGRAPAFAQSSRDRRGEALARYALARAPRRRGDVNLPRDHIRHAVAIVENLRSQINDRDYRAAYFATIHDLYRFYIDLLMQMNGPRPGDRPGGEELTELAFDLSERARARSLLELLTEARADAPHKADSRLLARSRELSGMINAEAERLIRLRGGRAHPARIAAGERRIGELKAKRQQITTQIPAAHSRHAHLEAPAAHLSLAEIRRQLLDPDTMLLSYSLGEDRSYVWDVTASGIAGYELPAGREVETAARGLYSLLTARQRRREESEVQAHARVEKADREYPVAARHEIARGRARGARAAGLHERRSESDSHGRHRRRRLDDLTA